MVLAISITAFMLLQIGAALLFKWGSADTGHYWWGFIGGNLLGITSILALMQIYKVLPANTAAAVCTGGSFVCIQIALSIVFRTGFHLSVTGGSLLILSGILWMSLCPGK